MTTTALDSTPRETALAPSDAPTVNLSAIFERLAANPEIPVDKMQALMEMQRSLLREQAEQAFNAAMSQAQADVRRVKADAYNKQTSSHYATYAALDRALRPIYTTHGFGLSFDTADAGAADMVRVLCYVTHAAGHTRTYRIDMPADGKGAKGGDVMTRTHAVGSASQYGMRYLLKMIFNVAIGEDDDGNGASAKPASQQAPTPAGFDDWWADLEATADNGIKALEAAWKASRADYRGYVTSHRGAGMEALKAKARGVKVTA